MDTDVTASRLSGIAADGLPAGFLLEHHSGYRLGREELLVRDVAREHGRTVELASLSQIQRRKVMAQPGIVVVGAVPFVKAALRALGQDLPVPNPYPLPLRTYLRRPVEIRPMKDALARIERGTPSFIKPADRWKSFTGCVPADGRDVRLNGASRSQNVWVSAPVRFVSEWRAYVLHGEVSHLAWYDGNRELRPDEQLIARAVQEYVGSGAPVGFVIDFGVLDSGETALVEANDGFSIGAYEGVSPLLYARLVSLRWQQLAAWGF